MKAIVCALLAGIFAAPLWAAESVVMIPGVVHSERTQTDLAVFNPNSVPDEVEITLLRADAAPQIRSFVLEPSEVRKMEDVVKTLFAGSGSGNLQIRAMAPLTINARQQRGDTAWYLAPSSDEEQIGNGDTADIVVHGAAAIWLSETAGTSATIAIDISGADGTPIRSESIDMRGFETVELPIDVSRGLEQRIHVSVVRGDGRLAVRGARFIEDESTALYPVINATATPRRRAVAPGNAIGHAILRLTMAVPAADRAEFVRHRGELEGNGYKLAADGSSVAFPDYIPAGWRVRIGTQTSTIDYTGKFTIRMTPGLPAQGEIFDPSDPQPLATFNVSQLSKPVVLQLPFSGVCTMNTGDSIVPNCHDPSAASTPARTIVADAAPPPQPTYPPAQRADTCDNIDGFISSSTSPLLSYFGSVCNKRVVVGCCPNEGGWLIFSATICCVKNHKGRFCQELSPGDVAILGAATPITVDLGETVTFTVHNNGCTGDTDVAYTTDPEVSLGGSLNGAGFNGATIQHYDADKLAQFDCGKGAPSAAWGIWIGDRTLTYTAPKCIGNPEHIVDDWTFGTDGASVSIRFQLKYDNLYQFFDGPSSGTVVSSANAAKDGWHIAQPDTGCTSMHIHGKHPCTGAPDPNPTGCGQGKVGKLQ